ncbi:MAG: SDR family oxidoreductase [Omnitrophica WOR_2 bacterium]
MEAQEIQVVTGAFGYSGKYIAARLLEQGYQVRTLTNSPQRANPFGNRVEAFPFNFTDPTRLAAALEGATVLYNTYWVRFNQHGFSQAQAVQNTLTLFDAARQAGVRRIVHVSITSPSEDSTLEYFRGKAQLERALKESGMSYAILRPTVLFGKEDILINNIAWVLRHLPAFGVFGDGEYRLQPVYVDDLARLAVEQGQHTTNRIIDATGPETFTYRDMVMVIGKSIGKNRPLIFLPPALAYDAGWILGKILGDVLITRDEIEGLMGGLLFTASPPAGKTKLTDWITANAASLGKRYASELRRRTDRVHAYEVIG